jgi:hypothetical protein
LKLILAIPHSGGLYGVSFGLLNIQQSYPGFGNALLLTSLVFCVSGIYFIKYKGLLTIRRGLSKEMEQSDLLPFLASSASFVFIWLAGVSFMYRLIVLLPVVIIMSRKNMPVVNL